MQLRDPSLTLTSPDHTARFARALAPQLGPGDVLLLSGDVGFEIWHADLYRLTMLDEVEELGLTDAFDTALCLIEWPDRLGPLRPENSLSLDFAHAQAAETRTLHLSWTDPRWDATVEGLIQ